ncbi:hypothetical protein CCMA1212_007303 [Trichoderma ghanense]|uniref:Uncharacterized protein n=1 Tax=Trichoderma ghanense TaxID=65468 RepID=A0ABY2GZY5_9HYPO
MQAPSDMKTRRRGGLSSSEVTAVERSEKTRREDNAGTGTRMPRGVSVSEGVKAKRTNRQRPQGKARRSVCEEADESRNEVLNEGRGGSVAAARVVCRRRTAKAGRDPIGVPTTAIDNLDSSGRVDPAGETTRWVAGAV